MAEEQTRRQCHQPEHSPSCGAAREHGVSLQKRQVRVTVKYNRKELQRRLDVEKWIDATLDQLYAGKEDDMPDEVNIDDLLDLMSDEERAQKLQELLEACTNSTEAFISELLVKLQGLHKQEELQSEGIEHPCVHGYPHHHSNTQHQGEGVQPQHHQRTHQTL